MSLLIKNVELPTDHPLWIVVHSDGTVEANEVSASRPVGWQTLRNAAVPVPPHGRLIDADALEMERRAENAKKGWHDSFAVVFNGDPYYEATYDCTEQFKELVNNAPTIIPAEEGE